MGRRGGPGGPEGGRGWWARGEARGEGTRGEGRGDEGRGARGEGRGRGKKQMWERERECGEDVQE